jgi:Tfp pilus assembly protein PilF
MSKLIKICSLALLVFFTFFKLLPAICLADGIDKNEIPVTCSSAEASQTFLNGLEAFEMGRINDAKDMFNKAIENDPQFAMAYLYLAYTANSDANWKRNMEFAMLNRNHVSEGEKILIDMESALSDKDATKRFELAKQIAELYPSSTRAQLVLAGEYQARNECTKFRDLTFNAILLNPNSPLGYRALAISYLFNEPLDCSLAQ